MTNPTCCRAVHCIRDAAPNQDMCTEHMGPAAREMNATLKLGGVELERFGPNGWRLGDHVFVEYEPRKWTIEMRDGSPIWAGTRYETAFTTCRSLSQAVALTLQMTS